MAEEILPKGFSELFKGFYVLNRGNAKEGIAESAKMLGVQ
jgi:hypothetical protein